MQLCVDWDTKRLRRDFWVDLPWSCEFNLQAYVVLLRPLNFLSILSRGGHFQEQSLGTYIISMCQKRVILPLFIL